MLHWHKREPWTQGRIAILLLEEADAENAAALAALHEGYGARGYRTLFQRRRPNDPTRIDALVRQAADGGVGAVVTGDVLYHAPDARLLQDVVMAIRHGCTVDELGYRREVNSGRALKSRERSDSPLRSLPPGTLQTSVDFAEARTFEPFWGQEASLPPY